MCRDSFDVIILAGGRSSRFGTDKCEFEIDGKTMLRRISEKFESPIIVTDKPRPVEGIHVIDSHKSGPLKAIEMGLEYVKEKRVFVTGCDFPFLSPKLVQNLCSKPEEVATTMYDGKIQPLLSCYSTNFLRSSIRRSRSLREIVYKAPSVYIAGYMEVYMWDPSLLTLLNVNRVSDLRDVKKSYWQTSICSNT
ncbi:MAG: molybdenum cofactor guanylyltransferase [Metallosphaera sp.]|uniref:Molybdopterin-guanine dinucleotide biosynthesis protein A-like protein n=1 Tax=Metallosphaera cuprina (strain Ar-4) TaxID=1006006 RepID=F4FZ63_METCR|nr:molybdenum cofactor guanylyltransferase [Metallosphaera cuprina]AEB94372.1 molybdopterin-guanine dinucleotide biosynthesis protein A-like protein [Metallosphaera cuprina Ar-4]